MKSLIVAFLIFNSSISCAEYLAEWSQSELLEKSNQHDGNIVIVDVRSKKEFLLGHIAGAINIPFDEVQNNYSKLDKDGKIILYCQSGRRAGIAEQVLSDNGYNNIIHLKGDFGAWQKNGLPIQR